MTWPLVKLGDMSEALTKGTTPTSVGFKFVESGINFVKVESITPSGQFLENKFAAISEECHESLKRSQLMEGDVLFSIAGALGRTALVSAEILPANTNQALAIIRLKTDVKIDKRYLLLALTTTVTLDQVEKHKGGVAQQNLSLGQLKCFDIPLPSMTEQKRIVAILDQAFADIDQARTKTEQNLKNVRELFESYLQQVFSQRDEGWAEATLKEVTASVLTGPFGSMLHKSDYVPDGLPLVNPINIRGEIIVPNDSKTVTQETADRLSSYILSEGDLVIARRGEIGRCAVVSLEQDGWVCGTGCFFIKPSNRLSSSYLAYLLRSPKYRDALERVSTGATMKNLSNTSLKNFVVAFPESIDEQLAILNAIDDMKEEISTVEDIYQSKLSALDELKKSILQKAFSGELTKVSKGVAA